MQKLLTFFSKNIWVYAKFNDQSDNDNHIVSFEKTGPWYFSHFPNDVVAS